MSAYRATKLECDHERCGATFIAIGSPPCARGDAAAKGWTTKRGLNAYGTRQSFDYCPKHPPR